MPITAEQLKIEELRLRYLDMIARPDVFPTRANWQFTSRNRMHGLGHALFAKFIAALTVDEVDREELHDIAIEEFPAYLQSIDRDEALDVAYSGIHSAPAEVSAIIHDCMLFDADYLLNLLDNDELPLVMQLLDSYQPEYSPADMEAMSLLLERLQNLPDLGHIEMRQGIFGMSEKYVCPAGHVNAADAEYCGHSGCGLDARGLTEAQEKALDDYTNRVGALRSLLAPEM